MQEKGAGKLKQITIRITALFCAVMIAVFANILPVSASGEAWSSAYAHTLNSAMLNCGVVSTSECGGFVDISAGCPTGVIYADLVSFTDNTDPCLVIMYSDAVNACVSIDVYKYNSKGNSARLITTVSKPTSSANTNICEFALADDGKYRYIVYNEYNGDALVYEEYYTVIDNTAFKRVKTPSQKDLFGILSFTQKYLHPEVDVSKYNHPLTVVFSTLKDGAAKNIEYPDILDEITTDEHESLSRVLSRAAGFTEEFDIGKFSAMSEYSLAVNRHDGEGVFNAITNVYDLGDEMYYIRYSTDLCFYNGTVVRRTDKVTDGYQILNVRNDFIPFSNIDLDNLKEAYSKNRLVLEKSSGSMEQKNEPIIKINKLNLDKPIELPQMVSPALRKPLALIGGGAILGLFILLWVYLSSDDKK